MALQDLISQPIPNPLEGLESGLKAGVDIASRLYEINKQQQLVELEKQKVKLSFQEKAVDLIPKIKGLKPQERGFFLNALSGFSKNAGMELPEDFINYLKTSEDTVSSMEGLVKAAYLKYPSQNQSVQRSGFVLDSIRQAGMNVTEAKPILDAMTADTLALVKRDQANAVENNKRAARIANIITKTNPPQTFKDQVATLSPEDQEAAYLSYSGVSSKLNSISKDFFLNKEKTKNLSQSDLAATRSIWQQAQALSKNPLGLPLAEQMISDLEKSLVGLGVKTAEVVQKKEGEAAAQKLSKEQSSQVSSLVKEFQNTAKPEIETINTASKVINILNNPKVSGTPLAWGAVGTLLSRYYDPRTGVKESELDRVLRSVQGSKVEQWKSSFFAFFKGKTLSNEQKNLIGSLINSELQDVDNNVKNIRSIIEQRTAGSGINPDLVFNSIFYKGVPKYVPVSGNVLSGDNPYAEKGFFEKAKERLFGPSAPEAAPAKAAPAKASPTPSVSPTQKAQGAPAAPAKAVTPGMGKQGLRKLFPGVSAPAQEPQKKAKKAKWVPVPGMPGVQELKEE